MVGKYFNLFTFSWFIVSTTSTTNNNNVFESTKKPTTKETTTPDPNPKHACHCGCTFSDDHGQFQTHYPNQQMMCTWNFLTKPDHLVMLQIEQLTNFKWKQGGLYIASPEHIIHKFRGKEGGIKYENMKRSQRVFTSIGNKMNLTLFNTFQSTDLDSSEIRFSYRTFRGKVPSHILLWTLINLNLSRWFL